MTLKNCILISLIIIVAGCHSPPKDDSLKELVPGWSNLVEKAKSQMTRSNGVNRLRYSLETPIFIPGSLEPTSTQPPGTLIAFPLKQQDSRLTSRGWTELGIIFWIPPEGDSHHTQYPNQIGMMYLVKVDKEGRAIRKHFAKPEFLNSETPNKEVEPLALP